MYNINLYCVIISINYQNNIIYVLSTDEHSLTFPKVEVDNTTLSNPQESFNQLLKTYLPEADEVEFFSQFIKLHERRLDTKDNTINCVHGFIINHVQKMNNCFWLRVNFKEDDAHHELLLEVIQKLK
jgi:predicted RNA-binding protein with EMAP domain